MAPIEHPAWCDRALCTAPAEQPAEMDADAGWRHVSAPVRLNLQVIGAEILPVADGGTVTAQLYQAVAPWQCETHLQIAAGQHRLHLVLSLHDALQTAATVGGLLALGAEDTAAVTGRKLAALRDSEPL